MERETQLDSSGAAIDNRVPTWLKPIVYVERKDAEELLRLQGEALYGLDDTTNLPRDWRGEGQVRYIRCRCLQCGLQFDTAPELKSHVTRHEAHLPEWREKARLARTCRTCGKVCSSVASLATHSKQHVTHTCGVCSATFRLRSRLKRHEATHFKPFRCHICQAGLSSRVGLEEHVRGHTQERPFMCPQCGRTFGRQGSLTAHMACHAPKPIVLCERCGAAFTSRRYLRRHVARHKLNDTGRRDFRCTQCPATFRTKDDVRKHSISHVTSREHQCSECGTTFKCASVLRKHMIKHEPNKGFPCSLCPKSFVKKKEIDNHMRTKHTIRKKYCCEQCSLYFSHTLSLRKHQRKFHPELLNEPIRPIEGEDKPKVSKPKGSGGASKKSRPKKKLVGSGQALKNTGDTERNELVPQDMTMQGMAQREEISRTQVAEGMESFVVPSMVRGVDIAGLMGYMAEGGMMGPAGVSGVAPGGSETKTSVGKTGGGNF